MRAVGLAIAHVVERVDRARQQAEREQRDRRAQHVLAVREVVREDQRRRDEQVLDPLVRAKRLEERARRAHSTPQGLSSLIFASTHSPLFSAIQASMLPSSGGMILQFDAVMNSSRQVSANVPSSLLHSSSFLTIGWPDFLSLTGSPSAFTRATSVTMMIALD